MLKLAKKIILQAINIYQKTLSPDHGAFSAVYPEGYCRYYPSCSEYAHQAIDKYGIWKGGCKSIFRIIRCNPFSKGGSDPLK